MCPDRILMEWSLSLEILLRVILLLLLCVLHLKFQPRNLYLAEVELHKDYRHPRKESRVTMQTVIFLIIFIPLLVITSQVLLRNYDETFNGLLAWNLAIITNAVITEGLKLAVSRPRPDLFYRCFPDGVPTTDLICTGTKADVTDGRKSFPSGHSSFAFCSLGFLTLWLRRKLRLTRCGGVATFIMCILPLIIATIISVTRVYDNRHHWQDVVGGSVLGCLVSYVSYNRYYRSVEARANY